MLNEVEDKAKKRRNYLKLFLKILIYPILAVLGLNVLLYLLLSIPYIQTKVVSYAISQIKPIVKTEVSIDQIQLKLFYHAHIKGFYIESQEKDTLLYVKDIDTQFNLWGLLKNQLTISSVELDGFVGNVSQKTPQDNFNFQFLIDAFSPSDTSKTPSTNPITVSIGDIRLKNGRLAYDVFSKPETSSFNASHIALRDIDVALHLGDIDLKKLNASISKLSIKDKSGLEIKNLQATIKSNDSIIGIKDLELDLPQSELKIEKISYNQSTNNLKVAGAISTISPNDFIPFVPSLQFLHDSISLQMTIDGNLPRIAVTNIQLSYGNEMNLEGKASISDCLHYATSDIAVQLDKFRISPQGIASFVRLGNPTFVTPAILNTLGEIRVKANLKGRLSKMKLTGDTWVKQGGVNISADISTDSIFQNLDIESKLYAQNFNLGALIDNPDIKRASLRADVLAKQSKDQAFSITASGSVDALEYKDATIRDVLFSGYYDPQKMGGSVNANLPVGKLDAKVDINNIDSTEYIFDILLSNLKVNRFYKNKKWKDPLLSFHLNGKLNGADINTLQGHIALENLHFRDQNFNFQSGAIDISSASEKEKHILAINSRLLKAKLSGKYNFAQLSDEFSNLMHSYLPSLFRENQKIKNETNCFDFDAIIGNTESLNPIFDLPMTIIDSVSINAKVDMPDRKIILKTNMPYIKYGDLSLKKGNITYLNTDSACSIDANIQMIQKFGNLNLKLGSIAQRDNLNTTLSFKTNEEDKPQINVDGQINVQTDFKETEERELISNFKIAQTEIDIKKLKLKLLPATITNKKSRTQISNFGITLDKEPYFGVDGTISNNPSDSLIIYFNKAQLGDLLEPFDIKHIHAVADGKIRLSNLLTQAQMYTEGFKLADIILFRDTLGTLDVESHWNKQLNNIDLHTSLSNGKTISEINGLIYPTKDSLNLAVKLDKFSLDWVQPFTSDLLNKLTGSLSSNLSINGKISSPSISGWLGANHLTVGVDYTNVFYSISDTINVSPDKIGFDNLIVKDADGNQAVATAEIVHNDFKEMKYLLDLKLDNLMVLNTASRTDSLFYGKVFASGNINIKGDQSGIDIKMKIKNNKNSSLNVLIPQSSDASNYTSIVYINTPKKDSTLTKASTSTKGALPLKLGVNLEVTPDIALGVVLNPITGDAMQIKGSGSIDFSYDMQADMMKAFGDYTLKSGSVKLKLQQLSTIQFQIKEGSKLHFVGDPMRTTFDITAYHRVKADLTTLDPSFANAGLPTTKVLVDCVLGIKGDMGKMNLSYDINLPDAGEEVQQKVKSLISTDEQKLKQFAYLIASGTFYSNNSSGGSLTSGLWTNIASSTLSSGLDAVLGNVLGDKWQIGTNIESNDGTFSNMDMSVSVSTKLFDDKLKLNTNVGYRTDQSNPNENPFIGDFDAEYELSHSIKLKAYNHTNDKLYDQASTTQGIGVIYTKEAKTLKELFHFSR